MSKAAVPTKVPRDQTVLDIEAMLSRYGATGFAYGWLGDNAMVGFEMRGKNIRLVVPIPRPGSARLRAEATAVARQGHTSRPRTDAAAHDQIARHHWRALLLVVKAKLDAVTSGIRSFEHEFGFDIVLADGQTVGEWLGPQIEERYLAGETLPFLPLPTKEPT